MPLLNGYISDCFRIGSSFVHIGTHPFVQISIQIEKTAVFIAIKGKKISVIFGKDAKGHVLVITFKGQPKVMGLFHECVLQLILCLI